MVRVDLPDGSIVNAQDGITIADFIKEHIGEGLLRAAVAANIDDTTVDLTTTLAKDCALTILTFNDKKGKEVFWHSAAHVLAIAVRRLFPQAKLTIGPPIEEGFYYDFYVEKPFTDKDIEAIQAEMKKIVKEDIPFKRRIVTYDEAKELHKDNKFKLEILEDYKDTELTVYANGDFVDLCRGPHVISTGRIKAFKLLRHSGAYWRGDSKREQLQRIYGIAYPKKDELKAYLAMLAEAEKRNHRIIGEKQKLFAVFDKIGKGLPVWLPKGEILKRQVEKFAIQTEEAFGYQRVSTPLLAKKELFEQSGHLPYYKGSMYPAMKMDDGEYYLKAMNCPMHHLIYNSSIRSYRDLPVRLAEYGICHRNELSGTLTGLQRVRSMNMNDAHIYCTKDQIKVEIKSVLEMIKMYYDVFGLTEYWFRLSLSDLSARDKYMDEPDNWKYSEQVLREVLQEMGLPFVEEKDEAAFYGPKIDVQFKNVYGREDTMSTVQLDFAAKKRFNLTYVDEKGEKNNEVFVIHRAPLSTHERFMAFLIEHFAGKFPLWMSPVQVAVLPIADRHVEYAKDVVKECKAAGLRVELDDRPLTTGKKVREAQIAQINYILVVGDSEVENKTVNVRTRDNEVHGEKKTDEFAKDLVKQVTLRSA